MSIVRHTSRGAIVGDHPSLRAALDVIDRVARSTSTVLVTGESGTGKELAVAALHDASARAAGPLVAVNCGAIPENLVESELFGCARGAFTGATTARRGVVAAAEGGTLFLDEVGELPLSTQVKLLRLLQQREYVPVGESRAVRCDLRIVAATNRDLAAAVRAGTFREDLYYRLDVVRVVLPALRERRSDIPLLAERFLRDAAARACRTDVVGFTAEATARLVASDWPGNVRALENAVERAVLLARGPYVTDDELTFAGDAPHAPRLHARAEEPEAVLPRSPVPSEPALSEGALEDGILDMRAAVEAYENGLIRQALARAGHNKTKAAQLLGLHRTTLVEMLKRKGIGNGKMAA